MEYANQFKPMMSKNIADYNSIIIQPPEEQKLHGRISKMLLIDSRDRNANQFPNPAEYNYDMKEPYKDVIEIELISASIPETENLINKSNNMLYICEHVGRILNITDNVLRETPPYISIHIPDGNYTKIELAEEITASITKSDLRAKYTVSYNHKTDKFTINSNLQDGITNQPLVCNLIFNGGSVPYGPDGNTGVDDRNRNQLKYKPASIGKVIGFDKVNATGKITGYIDVSKLSVSVYGKYTQFKTELRGGDILTIVNTDINAPITYNRLIVDTVISNTEFTVTANPTFTLTNAEAYADKVTGGFKCDFDGDNYIMLQIAQLNRYDAIDRALQDSFVRIPMGRHNHVDCTTTKEYGNIKYFNPPLQNLTKLRIKFIKYGGELYDFNGHEHSFVLAISCLNQSHKYLNTYR